MTLGFQVLFSFSQDRKNQCLLAKLFDFRDGYESTTDVDVTIHTNMFPYSQLPTLNFSGSCSFEMYALHRDVLRPDDRKEICGFISLHLGTFWCSFPLTIYEGEKSCPNISLLLFTRRVVFGRCHIRIDDLRLFGRLRSQTNIANLSLPPLTTITVSCPYHRFPPPGFALCAKSTLSDSTSCSTRLLYGHHIYQPKIFRHVPPPSRNFLKESAPRAESAEHILVPTDSEMWVFKWYQRNDHSSLQGYETELKVLESVHGAGVVFGASLFLPSCYSISRS